jgi:hypothetical protein
MLLKRLAAISARISKQERSTYKRTAEVEKERRVDSQMVCADSDFIADLDRGNSAALAKLDELERRG